MMPLISILVIQNNMCSKIFDFVVSLKLVEITSRCYFIESLQNDTSPLQRTAFPQIQ